MADESIIKDGLVYPEKLDPKDYVLGASRSAPFEVVNEAGDWTSYLPVHETQKKRMDSNGCTNFGSLNMLEIMVYFLYRLRRNYSERFQAVVSGQNRYGNDPQNVMESIRKLGALPDSLLPFTDDMGFEEYLSPKPMEKGYLKVAKEWTDAFVFKHEYIYDPYGGPDNEGKKKLLLEALKRSPVGVSVYAWVKRADGLYTKPEGVSDTHWCVLVGAKEGEYWVVYDSYEPHIKKLAWDFRFDIAKGIFLQERSEDDLEKVSLWEIIKSFFSFFKWILIR